MVSSTLGALPRTRVKAQSRGPSGLVRLMAWRMVGAVARRGQDRFRDLFKGKLLSFEVYDFEWRPGRSDTDLCESQGCFISRTDLTFLGLNFSCLKK